MKVYSHHLRGTLVPAEDIQREPEQFWTVKRSLFFAALCVVLVLHHAQWSAKL